MSAAGDSGCQPSIEALESVYAALSQAQDCIRGETPEYGTDEEAREDTISKVREAMRTVEAMQAAGVAQAGPEPVAWQYRVMFDKGSVREDEWCEWRDAGRRYFDKVNADIAAGATRVQTRALCVASALPSTDRGGK